MGWRWKRRCGKGVNFFDFFMVVWLGLGWVGGFVMVCFIMMGDIKGLGWI